MWLYVLVSVMWSCLSFYILDLIPFILPIIPIIATTQFIDTAARLRGRGLFYLLLNLVCAIAANVHGINVHVQVLTSYGTSLAQCIICVINIALYILVILVTIIEAFKRPSLY